MLEPVISVWKYLVAKTGLPIDPSAAAIVTIALGIVLKLLWSASKSRLEFERIAGELRRTQSGISTHIKQELDEQVGRLSKIQSSMETRIASSLEGVKTEVVGALHSAMQLTNVVSALPDDDSIEPELPASALSPKTRLDWANQVRQAIVARWLEGRDLRPTADDPQVFQFEGANEAGNVFSIRFRTPYRSKLGQDGSLGFTAELWVDNRKKLNFEWDSDGNYKLRGFTKGEWFADVADWNLVARHHDVKATAAA